MVISATTELLWTDNIQVSTKGWICVISSKRLLPLWSCRTTLIYTVFSCFLTSLSYLTFFSGIQPLTADHVKAFVHSSSKQDMLFIAVVMTKAATVDLGTAMAMWHLTLTVISNVLWKSLNKNGSPPFLGPAPGPLLSPGNRAVPLLWFVSERFHIVPGSLLLQIQIHPSLSPMPQITWQGSSPWNCLLLYLRKDQMISLTEHRCICKVFRGPQTTQAPKLMDGQCKKHKGGHPRSERKEHKFFV